MNFNKFAIIYYLTINLIAFAAYGIDKQKAKAEKWRIPEHTLLFLAFLGGGFGAFLGMKIFHHKTKKPKFRIWVPVWLIFHILLVCFCLYQNNHIVVSYYEYGMKLDSDLDSNQENESECRIVLLSDLHNTTFWFSKDYLSKKVQTLAPDVIVITGDVVDSTFPDVETALKTIEKLSILAPIYYVTGNHELALTDSDFTQLMTGLKNAGVVILKDEATLFSFEKNSFVLIGLDDASLIQDQILTNLALDSREQYEDKLQILLAHEPQYLNSYASTNVDFVLSGHAHGGQFILPFIGPLVAPDQGFFPKLTAGEVTSGATTMIISRGLGNSIIPVRLFNYPEIVVIDLK